MTASGDGRFVGRVNELTTLAEALREADGGRPGIVLVEGEPGIGKTALQRRFLEQHAEVAHLWVSGDEAEVSLALGLVDQLWAGLPPDIAPVRSSGDRGVPINGFTVGAELLTGLGRLEERGTLVVVVDDVHWTDSASAEALLFWLRRLREDCVLVLLAARPDGLALLGDSWARLIADPGRARRLRLGGLTAGDVRQLAVRSGQVVPPAAGERLREHTGGNPLYVVALLDELPAGALMDVGGELPAPHSYAATVLARVARLSAPARELVAAAAVLGTRSPVLLATAIAGLEPPFRALDEAVEEGLLTAAHRGGPQELAFPHPLVRAAVYDDLSPSRRGGLHLAAARLVARPAALAHRAAAAAGFDAELALDLAGIAAEEVSAGSARAAAEHLLWAGRLDPERGRAEDRLLRAVELLLLSGDVTGAHRHADAVRACAATAHQRFILGTLAASVGDLTRARKQLLGLVAELALPGEAPLFGRAAASLALVCGMLGAHSDAIRWATAAREVAGAVPTVDAIARQALSLALAASGLAAEATSLLAGQSASDSAPEPFGADLIMTRGVIRTWMDDVPGAADDLRAAIRWAQAGFPLTSVPYAYGALADAEYGVGAWADAITHAELAISLGHDLNHSWHLAHSHLVATCLYAARGEAEFAADSARGAREAAEGTPHPSGRAFSALAAGAVAWARADWRGVHEALLPMHDDTAGLPVGQPDIIRWLLLEAEAYLSTGRLDEAERALRRFRARSEALGRNGLEDRRLWGRLWQHRGDLPRARAVFDETFAETAKRPRPFRDALLSLEYGRLLIGAGERKSAVEPLSRSRALLIGLQARPFLAACNVALAACGVLTSEPGSDLDGLTSKEQVVARLVGKGMTNREVAAELYLTTKAIEYHLGNIFTKLGIRSRQQLTTEMAPEEGLASISGRRKPQPQPAEL